METWVVCVFEGTEGSGLAADTFLTLARTELQRIPGFLSATSWCCQKGTLTQGVVFQYADRDSAQAGLQVFLQRDLTLVNRGVAANPPQVVTFSPQKSQGVSLKEMPQGGVMSLVFRGGLGSRLEDELADLEQTMEALSFLPGYLGCARGPKQDDESDWVSIAFWKDDQAYQNSMPNKPLFDVQAFRKIG